MLRLLLSANEVSSMQFRRVFRRSVVMETILVGVWLYMATVADNGIERQLSLAIVGLLFFLIAVHIRFARRAADLLAHERLAWLACMIMLALLSCTIAHSLMSLRDTSSPAPRAVRVAISFISLAIKSLKTYVHGKIAIDIHRRNAIAEKTMPDVDNSPEYLALRGVPGEEGDDPNATR